MKKTESIFYLFMVLVFYQCSEKDENIIIEQSEKKDTKYIEDIVSAADYKNNDSQLNWIIDSTSLGKRGEYKIEMQQIYQSDCEAIANFILSKKIKGEWILKQEISVVKDCVTRLDPEFSDFNNDEFNDFTFQSGMAARGSNEIRTLYIFDEKVGKLIEIRNSDSYPNIRYNEELNCLDAWLVSGGSNSVFLTIQGDSLVEFAGVDLYDGDNEMGYTNREVYTIDKKGNMKTISLEKIKGLDSYTRYSNYDPLKELIDSD